jgi:hypothetical protein
MKRSLLLAMFGLVTLGSPNVATAGASEADTSASARAKSIPVPSAFVDAARQVRGLSGFALRDELDTIATSGEFWAGYRDLMVALADLPQTQQRVDDFLRDGAHHLLSIPGVPQHVVGRAYAATAALARIVELAGALVPTSPNMSSAMKHAATTFDALASKIDERLNDDSLPVAIRRKERRALRGLVASMVLGALEADVTDAERAELLSVYAEGMESLICVVALDLDDDAARQADAIIRDLHLEPLDREGLLQRAEDLRRAREILDSTADHLDGERLRLPPDAAFRSPSDA